MLWSYGVTTVPSRAGTLLPETLISLARAGFDRPRLFVDDCPLETAIQIRDKFGLGVTPRTPPGPIRTAANWHLTLLELYLREPTAERFAVFQDDLVACPGLREYLSRSMPAARCYLNLYTVAGNRSLARQRGRDGWFRANQCGKGALGLVFDNAGVRALLSTRHLIDRPLDPVMGWRKVDGGVVEAMRKAGRRSDNKGRDNWDWVEEAFEEYAHRPSLVQHTGRYSAMEKREDATAHDPAFPLYEWPPSSFAEDFREGFNPNWIPPG